MAAVVPIRPDMIAKIVKGGHAAREPFDPSKRGFAILYRGAETACPGCGNTHWHVGRITAECAFCGTALPLVFDTKTEPKPPIMKRCGPFRSML